MRLHRCLIFDADIPRSDPPDAVHGCRLHEHLLVVRAFLALLDRCVHDRQHPHRLIRVPPVTFYPHVRERSRESKALMNSVASFQKIQIQAVP
jgi:hypothetical protein